MHSRKFIRISPPQKYKRLSRIILKDRESDVGVDASGLRSSIQKEFGCYKRKWVLGAEGELSPIEGNM